MWPWQVLDGQPISKAEQHQADEKFSGKAPRSLPVRMWHPGCGWEGMVGRRVYDAMVDVWGVVFVAANNMVFAGFMQFVVLCRHLCLGSVQGAG